jgi:DNA mismatch endonuclease (patch repair protein)
LTLDIDFRGARVAVFVDGHYWHCCPVHGRPRVGGVNAKRWAAKFARVDVRERRAAELLELRGYVVLRYPECRVRANTADVCAEIRQVWSPRGAPGSNYPRSGTLAVVS